MDGCFVVGCVEVGDVGSDDEHGRLGLYRCLMP